MGDNRTAFSMGDSAHLNPPIWPPSFYSKLSPKPIVKNNSRRNFARMPSYSVNGVEKRRRDEVQTIHGTPTGADVVFMLRTHAAASDDGKTVFARARQSNRHHLCNRRWGDPNTAARFFARLASRHVHCGASIVAFPYGQKVPNR